jgi:hypothetical protein
MLLCVSVYHALIRAAMTVFRLGICCQLLAPPLRYLGAERLAEDIAVLGAGCL